MAPLSRPSHRPSLRSSLAGLRRRPFAWWIAATVLAALTSTVIGGMVAAAEHERARYGETRAALVAVRDLPAGHVLAPGDTEVRHLPAVLLPEGTLRGPVDGAPLTVPVLAGEPIPRAKVAPAGLGAVAALVPPGSRALAVPSGPADLRLARGDVVDVLATLDPALGGEAGQPTFPVARSALVIDVGEDGVTVAVSEHEAPRLAFVLTAGVVTLALTGGR